MGERSVKDFSMPLSDLGEPDEGFSSRKAGWFGGWFGKEFSYEDFSDLVKWTVQEPAGGRREQEPAGGRRGRFFFPCNFQDRAEVHFTGKLLDGTVFASSRENRAPLLLSCYGDDVMRGFSEAIGSMEPGEKSIFTVPVALTLTQKGRSPSIPWNVPPGQTLRFDIELISFLSDILRDQGILKKIIKLGDGTEEYPMDLDQVLVNYNVRLKDGSSVSKSEEVEFSVREGFFCPAFAHAVKTMEKGEEAILVIKPECKNTYKSSLKELLESILSAKPHRRKFSPPTTTNTGSK